MHKHVDNEKKRPLKVLWTLLLVFKVPTNCSLAIDVGEFTGWNCEGHDCYYAAIVFVTPGIFMSETLLWMQACAAGDSAAYERRASGMDDVVIVSALRTPITKVWSSALYLSAFPLISVSFWGALSDVCCLCFFLSCAGQAWRP